MRVVCSSAHPSRSRRAQSPIEKKWIKIARFLPFEWHVRPFRTGDGRETYFAVQNSWTLPLRFASFNQVLRLRLASAQDDRLFRERG